MDFFFCAMRRVRVLRNQFWRPCVTGDLKEEETDAVDQTQSEAFPFEGKEVSPPTLPLPRRAWVIGAPQCGAKTVR